MLATYRSYEWTRVYAGYSGVPTYRLTAPGRTSLYAKQVELGTRSRRYDVSEEAARIEWLAKQGIPGPELVDTGVDEGAAWLVMTAVPGRSGADPWPISRRNAVIDAFADALTALHALPAEDCPFDHRLDVMLALPGGAELAPLRPQREELVVCHGDYCLPNVLFDVETLELTGVIDLGGLGLADHYQDFADAVHSIGSDELNPQYAPAHAARFLDRVGADPDDERLSFYPRLGDLF